MRKYGIFKKKSSSISYYDSFLNTVVTAFIQCQTTGPMNDLFFDKVYGPEPTNTFLLGPILPEAVSHHCLIKQANAAKYLLIGGTTPTNKFSSKVTTLFIKVQIL